MPADASSTQIEGPAPWSPEIAASATDQAQHQTANDTPTDVNYNAIVARSQALTVDIAGKSYESNADRRNKLADAGAGIFKVS